MRIATFNCNSIRQRLPQLLEWLAANQPDLLALQETKVADELFPADAICAAGWHVAFRGQKAYNGVAMITRALPESASFGLQDGDGDESAPRLADVRLGPVRVLNTYIPNGQAPDSPKYTFKLDWYARLRRYLDQRYDPAREPLIWLGDLNVAPTPDDVYDSPRLWGDVCHCQATTDAFQQVCAWGLTDVFRRHLPGPGHYTFWDYRDIRAQDRGLGWRIDHILAPPALAARSTRLWVDTAARRAEKPSDHTFVVADFEL